MSEEKKDFVVKDRRFFTEESEKKEPAQDQAKSKPAAAGKTEPKPAEQPGKAAPKSEPADEAPLPEINFSTFIFSLNASALVNLGVIDNPATSAKEKNLPLAKQTIDILGMLQEKTLGNLVKEEEELLKNILYDLRLLFVKEKK